jgi:hypothetical protein
VPEEANLRMDVITNNPSGTVQKSQDLFKEKVLTYYKQLDKGCGKMNCESVFCKSCPGMKKFFLEVNSKVTS